MSVRRITGDAGAEPKRVVLVTGDRHAREEVWADPIFRSLMAVVRGGLSGPRVDFDEVLVIHGGCRGIDQLADKIARSIGCRIEVFPYPGNMGKRGGPFRNRQMRDRALKLRTDGASVALFAFHRAIEASKGTADMLSAMAGTGVRCTLWRDPSGEGRKSWSA